MDRTEVLLIDSDIHRRATIAHALTNLASYVIPLEHYSELTQCWPRHAVLLIEDAGSAVESLCRLLKLHGKDLPFVAFSADASPMRRSAALLKGAGAYLPWPCSHEELKSTLLSVAARHASAHAPDGAEAPAALARPSGFPQFAAAQATPSAQPELRDMRDLWRPASAPSVERMPSTAS